MIGDDDLDRLLTKHESVVPSDAFTGSVMRAVASEASAPPPMPFPWRQALAGLMALGAAIGMAASGANAPEIDMSIDTEALARASWIGLALLVTFASVRLSSWLADSRS